MSAVSPAYPIDESPLPRSGIRLLRDACAAYFQAEGVPAVVAPVGLKYRFYQLNQQEGTRANRVVFIPGEFTGEQTLKPRAYGKLSRDTVNSASTVNPREILAWDRPMTLSVWVAPQPGATEDEGAATELAEDLLEQVVRAITYADDANGNSLAASVEWGDVTINSPPNESAFGLELLVSLVQKGPLFDKTLNVVKGQPATPMIPEGVWK